MNFDITLLATVKEQPKIEHIKNIEQYCKCFIINRSSSLVGFLSFLPYQVFSRIPNGEGVKKIFKFLYSKEFDFVLVEHHYSFGLFKKIKKYIKYKRVFMRIHNDEPVYFYELFIAAKDIIHKLFYFSEYLKFLIYERKIFVDSEINNFLCISYDECLRYSKRYPKNEFVFFPPHVEIKELKVPDKKNTMNILFLGSLFVSFNYEGIKWFLENVHSELISKYELYNCMVAGNTHGGKEFELYFRRFNKVMFYDTPDSLAEIYQQSKIFISPLFHGAGVKIKVVNAIINGLPVVSTSKGIEGTGLTHGRDVLVADNEKDFLSCLMKLLEDDELCLNLVKSAQCYLVENYDAVKNFKKILSL